MGLPLVIVVVIGVREVIETIEAYTSQKDLARKMGVGPRIIRKWKTGKRKPTKAHMEKLRRIRGGYQGQGTKKPIYRKRRITRDIHGKKVLAQSAGAEGELHGYVDAPDVDAFIGEVKAILREGFHGEAFARFRTIYQWMQFGNLFSGIQIGVKFDMQYAEKLMGSIVHRKGVTMFSKSWPPNGEDYREALNDLIENLVENFIKWLKQSPLDFLEINFTNWFIISYRYKGL